MLSIFSSLFTSKKEQYKQVHLLSPEEFKIAISHKNIQLLDVRTPKEYKTSHIKNATNANYFNSKKFQSVCQSLDNTKPVYLYCRSGNRSQKASKILVKMGFKNIYDLQGGYLAWQ